MDSYYDNLIEKSTTHKYIRRVPKSSGKGYNYFYPEDFKKPFKALLSFFGMKEDKIDKAYENNNINQAYGVTKQSFAQHVLEYLTNRKTWNTFFANKNNRDKYKVPEKAGAKEKETVEVKEKVIEGGKTVEKVTEKVTETKEKNFKSSWNRSLMRKIYSMYNSVPEDKTENKPGIDSIKVGDSVSYNGRVGKVTKDFENGMVFINFENGGMGRFFVKDLQKMNVTADEVTESTELNAAEQNVNGTNETVQEEIKTESNNSNKERIKTQFKVEHEEHTLDDLKKLKIDIQDNIKMSANDEYSQPEDIERLNTQLEAVDEMIAERDTSALSQAMMGNQNARKYGNLSEEANEVIEIKNPELPEPLKNFLSIAYKALVKMNPVMNKYYYIEQLKEKYPKLVEKVTDWNEIIENDNIQLTDDDVRRFKEMAKTGEDTTSTDSNKPTTEEMKRAVADEFVVGKQKYLNSKPLTSNNARLTFDKIWDNLKDKTRNEQIRGLYSAIKDDYPMAWTDSLEYKKQGLSDEEIRFGYINDYLNNHSDIAEHNNRSEAMLGNQNARKDGLTQDEADSLEYYVQDAGYTYINDKLRGVDETPMEQHHQKAVENIDNVIARNTVKEKNLYRGIGGNVIFPEMNPYEHRLMELYLSNKDAYDSLPNDNWFDGVKYTNAKDNVEKYIMEIKGKTFNDKGFVSTSKNIKDTNVFTDSHKNPVIIEFENIPENTHGVDLSQFEEGREFRAENEVLLHRDLNYKITGMKNFGGKVVLTAEILPETKNNIASDVGEGKYVAEMTGSDGMLYRNHFKTMEEAERSVKNHQELGYESHVVIEETEEEKHKNRSDAMLGNDNAAGERAKKPQTEKAMKKEEKKLEKARTEAGLPKPQMFERTSTIDDSTWDPNSENYRFRDTGYIAGARKEQAALYITRSAKEGVRVNAKEVDWNGIEENPRTAEKLIVKSNIFGEVDWNGLREKGMSGSAAFLIDRIYASAGAKPDENSPDARHNYVIALNGLRDRFESCKTVEDVLNTLSEIKDEINGEYMEIKESPKYIELQNKRKELRDIALAKKAELENLSESGNKEYEVEKQKLVEKYIEKAKKEKLVRWNTRMSSYNIPEKYRADYEREERELARKTVEPWKKGVEEFKAELKARGVTDDEFFETSPYNGTKHEIGWYDLWRITPEMKEFRKLGEELDKYVEGQKVVVGMKNPLLEAWKTLGSKFTNITRSDTFAQHRYDCKKGKYDDWSWAEKDVTVKVKKQSKERKVFNFLVAETIERKGGRNVDITSTADLKKAFNLRDVQSGNWVLKDPESAEFHVRNAARAFADLADITGIPDDKISLNGRLAMAFGARGTGNAGGSTAMAHYEFEERVINLTKFKGGGCLGHEWFHAFDNLLTCAMGGDNAASVFLTNKYSNLTPATKSLVLEYLKYKNSNDWSAEYQRRKIAKKLADKNFDVKKLDEPQTDLQIKVQNAFDELVKAMTTGTTNIKSVVVYSDKDYKDMLYTMSDTNIKLQRDMYAAGRRSKPSLVIDIADAGSLDKAVDKINERYAGTTDKSLLKNKSEWVRLAAAYYDRNPSGNKLGNRLVVNSGNVGSQFLADAFDLDENGEHKDYWSTTHEMAARAFSAYIEDTLEEQGRKNDYLAYKSDNKYYDGGRPYPEGEERKRINAAFKKLFEVVRENNAIEKAIMISDMPDFIIKNGRFLIRK